MNKNKTNTMQALVLTEAERLRMHEDQRISADYRELRNANPGASDLRIVRTLIASGKFKPKSVAGIRAALIRTGAIKPVKRS